MGNLVVLVLSTVSLALLLDLLLAVMVKAVEAKDEATSAADRANDDG